uniref:SCA7 domain-containing protein n=1 Tax=Petromyzon marinus TaxID=7757 RepID=S4RJY2_PETMA
VCAMAALAVRRDAADVTIVASVRADMHIFGCCPAQDEFYLVMCNQCKQNIKPQAFQSHCERRHGLPRRSSTSPSAQSHLQTLPKKHKSSGGGSNSSSSQRGADGSVRHPKPHRDKPGDRSSANTTSSQERTVGKCKASGHSGAGAPAGHAASQPKSSSGGSGSASTGLLNSSPQRPPHKPGLPKSQVPTHSSPQKLPHPSPQHSKPVPGLSASTRQPAQALQKLTDRDFDPNSHCGVWDPQSERQCTRSLTCKTHSLSQRRAVPGRRKQFDTLLAEHRAQSREREREKE